MNIIFKAAEVIEKKVNEDFDGFLATGFPPISVWLYYNILTWYITHKAVSLNHRVKLAKRSRTAFDHFDD